MVSKAKGIWVGIPKSFVAKLHFIGPNSHRHTLKTEKLIHWIPPNHSFVKLNSNRVSLGNLDKSGVGGNIRVPTKGTLEVPPMECPSRCTRAHIGYQGNTRVGNDGTHRVSMEYPSKGTYGVPRAPRVFPSSLARVWVVTILVGVLVSPIVVARISSSGAFARGKAVDNTVDMQSLFLLTGPNGGRKSSLLRSICAAALLKKHVTNLPCLGIPHPDALMIVETDALDI
ncbi:hypothetical protein ACH5RR_018364 [Cinchona calisaya]|uniref:Uncharacterized protein n=1 Tax=Cinchona calisaya TaxID=153742 RepID=A0ABD2ZPV7_9GENT